MISTTFKDRFKEFGREMKAHISKELADWLKIPGYVDKFGKALAESNLDERIIILEKGGDANESRKDNA